jgi:hypothetical protein
MRENRMIARNNRILFTSYLMENGYTNPYEIARFWGVSVNTAKTYMKEAEYVKLSDEGREEIKEIQKKHDCDLPKALAIKYNKLTNQKSCFIATASYGTPFAKEIDVLREWRDKSLMTNLLGKVFVKFYYTTSPPIANVISRSEKLKKCVRTTLNPFVKHLKSPF